MGAIEDEYQFREAIIAAVLQAADYGNGSLSRAELEAFSFLGKRYRLIDSQGGIWNPGASAKDSWPHVGLAATMSITTTLKSPYTDAEDEEGLWRYAYQRGGLDGKNRKLRQAMTLKLPVLWLKQIATGRYVPYRVFVVRDLPAEEFFSISPDLALAEKVSDGSEIERSYAIRETKFRRHQREFRARVLMAYQSRCAICSLRHEPLLEAAHITPDREADSTAEVSNGLSLCRIHHTAYDVNILGISPDRVVHVSESILAEVDGPMLQHGIKEMNGRELWIPSAKAHKPDEARLSRRFDQFLAASA